MWIAVIFFNKAKLYKTITRLSLRCVGIHVIGSSRKGPLPTEFEKGLLLSGFLLSYSENKIYLETGWKFLKNLIRVTV